jgi:DNA-binding transcriptional ArsR family regulator
MVTAFKELRELRLLLRACADVTRLRILRLLADGGERSVSDLTAALYLSQPLVSWHLRILRRSGLIATRRTGRQALYRLNRGGWDAFRGRLEQVAVPSLGTSWEAELGPRLPALRRQEIPG